MSQMVKITIKEKSAHDAGNEWAKKAAWTAFVTAGGVFTAVVLYYLGLLPAAISAGVVIAMQDWIKKKQAGE